MNLILTPGKVTLSEFSQIYWKNPDVTLNQKSKSAVEKAVRIVEQAAGGDAPVYGSTPDSANWPEFGFQQNKPPFCSVT